MHFITNEPALFLERERTLVVADLHLGIEYDYKASGIKMPSGAKGILERLEKLIEKTKPKKLIIIGDIKHKVPGTTLQEEREIPHLFRQLTKKQGLKVEIVPGNHDGGIGRYIPEGVRLHSASGARFGDFYLCHGHAWPGEDLIGAKAVITSHNHPCIEFRDSLGYRWSEPVWLRARLIKSRLEERYRKKFSSTPELIIMPAFNPLSGGFCLNKKPFEGKMPKPMGPLARIAKLGNGRVYMLDGTLLGKLRDL